MNSEELQSKNVARILDQTAARATKMQVEEIVPAFDEAEATCLAETTSTELQLEVKRRVAEWKMKLLCDRDAAFELVESLRNDLSRLGYSNLEIEGTTEIYFAQYCVRNNKADVARQVLEQIRSNLDAALKTNDLESYRHLKEESEQLLSNINEQ